MTITTILLAVFGALLVAAYALWDLGADRLVAGFGRLVIRALTFGRVRIAEDADETTAMAISAATVLVLFLSVLISLHSCTDVDTKSSNQSVELIVTRRSLT